jgi:hypothetical protein
MRRLGVILAVWSVLVGSVSPVGATSLLDLVGELQRTTAAAPLELQHQLRNAAAMADLVSDLPESRRPSRLLYLASGSHLAPLVICDALPGEVPCALTYTEVDASVQHPLQRGLEALAAANVVGDVEAGEPLEGPGSRVWRFRQGGRPVTLTLRVQAPAADRPRLVRAADLGATDLVLSHDWSGDPLINLEVILQLLIAARAKPDPPPMLMIEDLSRHPYPVDLSLFGPVARTRHAFGHRTSDAGLGHHGSVELGPSLFGGGVLLGFAPDWWRRLDLAALEGVFDLLLFSQFDVHRQNVLEGGDEPLVAPSLLDWWSGYGVRTISGGNIVHDPDARSRMLVAAARLAPLLDAAQGRRLACRLQMYRGLLQLVAAGVDLAPMLPPASMSRRLEPGSLPSVDMERLHREAEANLAVLRAMERRWRTEAGELLAVLDTPAVAAAAAACPLPERAAEEPATEYWARVYGELVRILE